MTNTVQDRMTIITAMLTKLYNALDRGDLTGDEAERIHWVLLNSDGEVRALVGSVLDKLAVLHIDMKKGRFPASDLEKLRRPLLAMIGPVFPQSPPSKPAPASSAGRPTVRLRPPGMSRWHYMVVTAASEGGPSAKSPPDLQVILDRHGADGWELAACQSFDGQLLLIFKRSDV